MVANQSFYQNHANADQEGVGAIEKVCNFTQAQYITLILYE